MRPSPKLRRALGRRLEHLGLDVDLWSMDLLALRAHPDFPGTEVPRTEASGLVGSTPGQGEGPALVLQGHVDVVPPGDLGEWVGDPIVPLGDVGRRRPRPRRL